MSKTFKPAIIVFGTLLLILQSFYNSDAQSLTVRINIHAVSHTASVSGTFSEPQKNLVFVNDAAGAAGLAERVSGLSLTDADGKDVEYKRLMAGEYLAAIKFSGFAYNFALSAPKSSAAAAHVSWTNDDFALVYLDDILPQILRGARTANVSLVEPQDWIIYSSSRRKPDGKFDLLDIEKAVFYVLKPGNSTLTIRRNGLETLVNGNWKFSYDDASNAVSEIFDEYNRLFISAPSQNPTITIMHFPGDVQPGVWEADTRGSSITILSSDMPFKSQSLQRLHEQLRHEMFHLWLPNGVNLSGRYDWFYEGFALYRSLKAGLALNRIRFDDYLQTLSNGAAIDALETRRMSLIDASNRRWSGANSYVYARGMLTAFLCDIEMLKASKGKASVDDLLSTLYSRHPLTASRSDGTEAAVSIISERKELIPIVSAYIRGDEPIDVSKYLDGSGITATGGRSLRLSVKEKLTGREKVILDKLGYNNWRKLAGK